MAEDNYTGRGFTEGDLKIANWWVAHEVQIIRWSKFTLYALNVLVWGYVAWGLLDAYAISYPRESRIIQEIALDQQKLVLLEQNRPQNVGTSQVLVFSTTDKRVDIMVDVQNPNTDWWAEFSYKFNIAGEQTHAHQGFILPKGKVTLTELGYIPKTQGVRSGQLVVENIRWHRVDPVLVQGDYDGYIKNRFGSVSVQNIQFKTASSALASARPRTQFDVVNNGAFGYWSIIYVIKLYRGNTVIAVNQIDIRELKPGETRSVDLAWFDQIPSVTKTEVIPIINLLDPGAFLPSDRLGI